MRKVTFFISFLLIAGGMAFCNSVYSQSMGISTTGVTPSANAILDLNTGNTTGTDKYAFGFILPHAELGSSLTTFGMANSSTVNDTGMMIYNMGGTQTKGCYYSNRTTWAGAAWFWTGNSGTTPSTSLIGATVNNNFIGTTDAHDFVFVSNGYEGMRVASGGNVGINTKCPVSTLDDSGSIGTGIEDITESAGTSQALPNSGKYSTYVATPPAVGSTYTLTLPSATANPRRVYTIVYNGNSLGTIALTSPVAGNIKANGATTSPFNITSGSVVIQSDGANWNVTGQTTVYSTNGALIGIKVFSTAGTVSSQSFDAGTLSIQFEIVGGGGAGGGITSTSSLPGSGNTDWVGAGGGAGGYCEGYVTGLTSSSTFSGAVGAGGTGGVPTLSGSTSNVVCTAPSSSNGGASTLTIGGTTYTANGGGGGTTSEMTATTVTIQIIGGTGGTASGGSINVTGSTGGQSEASYTGTDDDDYSGAGAGSIYGTGGFGSTTRDPTYIAGLPGTGVGSGGSGAIAALAKYSSSGTSKANGGSGAAGIIIIYEYD